MRIKAKLSVVLAILFLASCAPSRFVKPLDKGTHAVSASLGGPMIRFAGAPMPIPFTTVSYGYGLRDKVTIFGGLHTTSLLFGNLQFDAGATIALMAKENRMGLSITPALQFAATTGAARIWPSADLNFYSKIGKGGSFVYAGTGAWFELSQEKAHGEKQQAWAVPALQLGITRVRSKWQQQLEFKYLAPGQNTLPGVVDYIGFGRRGVTGIYFSLTRKI